MRIALVLVLALVGLAANPVEAARAPTPQELDAFVREIADQPRWGITIDALISYGDVWPRGVRIERHYGNLPEWRITTFARQLATIGRGQAEFVRLIRIKPLWQVADHPGRQDRLARAYWRAELAYWQAVQEEMLALERYALNGAPRSWAEPYAPFSLRPRNAELAAANYEAMLEAYRERRQAAAVVAAVACELWTEMGYASAQAVCAAPTERPVPPREGEWP